MPKTEGAASVISWWVGVCFCVGVLLVLRLIPRRRILPVRLGMVARCSMGHGCLPLWFCRRSSPCERRHVTYMPNASWRRRGRKARG